MALLAVALIMLAGLLHAWYAGHAVAKPGHAARGFHVVGPGVLVASIVMLVGGLALLWFLTGFLSALAAAGVYFFVLPLITMPLLEALKVIPERKDRYSKEDR
ncbi:MAG: hypothetical protein L0177_14150 [Chloroflexi bacterium]|nr:hypothetical protein [Chloroflexota bacterium]